MLCVFMLLFPSGPRGEVKLKLSGRALAGSQYFLEKLRVGLSFHLTCVLIAFKTLQH